MDFYGFIYGIETIVQRLHPEKFDENATGVMCRIIEKVKREL